MKHLGTVIEHQLINTGTTRKTYAAHVGISVTYLSEIITGTKLPSLYMLIDLANGLNMTASELLHRAEHVEAQWARLKENHEQAQRVEAVQSRPTRLPQHQGRS